MQVALGWSFAVSGFFSIRGPENRRKLQIMKKKHSLSQIFAFIGGFGIHGFHIFLECNPRESRGKLVP
jgi:hypothetical protein